MPLHKSSRASRLDPTMISAPLGDFRHTMHIGRGGDAFGDTSFLSTHGPSSPSTNSVQGTLSTVDSDIPLNSDASDDNSLQTCELRHSESVSSLTLDLDLGPSILGDVLGIMDGLVLDSEWTTSKVGVFSPGQSVAELELGGCGENLFVNVKNDMEVYGEALREKLDGQMTEESGPKLKGAGPRPKVRFSDKRDEIIGRDEEREGLEQDPAGFVSPSEGQCEKGNGMSSYCHERLVREAEPANHSANSPPSPASSLGSEYEGVPPLDRRRGNDHLSESESESEEEGVGCERGYTFEDEFDDEIGL